MAHSVLAVANEFISRGFGADRLLTPMQLQKLCYMSHGYNLALNEKPLVRDRLEAWDFGPVFPALYQALKRYGADEVDSLIRENNWANSERVRGEPIRENLQMSEAAVVNAVFEVYGEFPAFRLSDFSHAEGSPWQKLYRHGHRHIKIPDDMLRNYFSELAKSA